MIGKNLFCLPCLVLVAVLSLYNRSQASSIREKDKKVHIELYGLLNPTMELGSIEDYVPGENDFPVTPSFLCLGGGCGLWLKLADRFIARLSLDYLPGSEVDKKDPSDGERVSYKTYNNMNILGSMIYTFHGKIQPFISGGGGINILFPYPDRETQGSLGSIIFIEAPDQTINPIASFGGGILFNIKKYFLNLEVLYTLGFNSRPNSILFRLGLVF